MQRKVYPMIARLLILGCMAVIAVWALTGGFSARQSTPPPTGVANVPQQAQQQGKGQAPAVPAVPAPQGTRQIPLPIITPSRTPPPSTPTPAPLQAATLITPTILPPLTSDPNTVLSQKSTINSSEAIHSETWAPTGDKLVYVTNSGKLYWSDTDGSNATLLHTYNSNAINNLLENQQPKSNTLFVPGYAIKFTLGAAPVLITASATTGLRDIRWWSSTRASGITGGVLGRGNVGGEQLVTLDDSGNQISTRNIPYMQSGAVQPGGAWLAYATSQQNTSVQLSGSSPETIYLLNLNTGQRLQLTPPGMGIEVFSWSPDGNWIFISAVVNSALEGVLVSADGTQWIVTTPAGHSGYDTVWSPDGKHLAYSVLDGGCDAEDAQPCPPLTSQVYVVNVPARKSSNLSDPGAASNSTGQMMRPQWSPNGSVLTLLSFDPTCEENCPCTELTPALYQMNVITK